MGGIYFINHKTKDYFPEGARLLNLLMNTLKEEKNHDSQLFLGDRHFSQENCDRKHATGRQHRANVPWTFSKGPKVSDLQGNFRGPIQKLIILWKNYFSELIVLVLHICKDIKFLTFVSVFYRKNKYSNTLNGYVHGTSTGPSCETSLGPNDGKF